MPAEANEAFLLGFLVVWSSNVCHDDRPSCTLYEGDTNLKLIQNLPCNNQIMSKPQKFFHSFLAKKFVKKTNQEQISHHIQDNSRFRARLECCKGDNTACMSFGNTICSSLHTLNFKNGKRRDLGALIVLKLFPI